MFSNGCCLVAVVILEIEAHTIGVSHAYAVADVVIGIAHGIWLSVYDPSLVHKPPAKVVRGGRLILKRPVLR